MKFVSSCLIFFSLLSSAVLISSKAYADKILLLGDSISAAYDMPWESGWAQLLAKDLADEHELINASVSGETTGGGLARLQTLIDEHQPDWVMVELGGNDGLRGHPIRVIRSNLQQISKVAEQNGVKPIIAGIRIPPNYGERYNTAFQAIFPEVAAEFNAPYFNVYLEEVVLNPEMMLDDGIHPSEAAQPIIRDHVAELLEAVLN